jgi:hypothetical protein
VGEILRYILHYLPCHVKQVACYVGLHVEKMTQWGAAFSKMIAMQGDIW